jgi:isocitrate dehydrogenase
MTLQEISSPVSVLCPASCPVEKAFEEFFLSLRQNQHGNWIVRGVWIIRKGSSIKSNQLVPVINYIG